MQKKLSNDLLLLVFQALKKESFIKKLKKKNERSFVKRVFNKIRQNLSNRKKIETFKKAFFDKYDVNLKLKYFCAIKEYDVKIKLKNAKVQNIFEKFKKLNQGNKRRMIFNIIKNYYKICKNGGKRLHSNTIGTSLYKTFT